MVDWNFIGSLEGVALLGYVPDPQHSNSGVTIATGVDLGQLTADTLAGMNLASDLAARLRPYIGLRGRVAVTFLGPNPLVITQPEADLLDAAAEKTALDALMAFWVLDTPVAFVSLPAVAQTIIASVAFQYGPDLERRCPRFWHCATTQNWVGMLAELRNFGDQYPTRRNQEADYLAAGLAAQTAAARLARG